MNFLKIAIVVTTILLSINIQAGGFIIADPEAGVIDPMWREIWPPRPMPPLRAYLLHNKTQQVKVIVNDFIAHTTVEQEFYNPGPQRMEGHFYFPLPAGAKLSDFSMWINGKETKAELLDATKARTIYEDIVRKLKDPALLEFGKGGLLKMRIFPIEPYSTPKVKITYSQTLRDEDGVLEYQYALGHPQHYAAPITSLSFDVDINHQAGINSLLCLTHPTDVRQRDVNKAHLSYEGQNVLPNGDFLLSIGHGKLHQGFAMSQYRKSAEPGYFALQIDPVWEELGREIIPKDITFVLDCSGSMSAEKMNQARAALQFCIDHLNSDDRFNIIRFSTEAQALFPHIHDVNPTALSEAKSFIENLRAIGGTNLEEALQMALKQRQTSEDRPFHIVLITDGKPTIGKTDADALVASFEAVNNKHTRIFTFGIGEDLNARLLDLLTEKTNGYRSYLGKEEDMEIKISSLVEKISSPVLTGLSIHSDGVSITDLYPKHLPDLFAGSSILLLGRYKKEGEAVITLTGSHKGKEHRFRFPVKFVSDSRKNEIIPALWATRRVGFLLDQIRMNGNDKELVNEITTLAREFGIVTPYTSYLILEDETLHTGPIPRPHPVPMPIPRGDEDRTSMRKQYEEMQAPSGSVSIESSRSTNAMRHVTNASDNKLSHYWTTSENLNAAQMIQLINIAGGRAFYHDGEQWNDAWIGSYGQLRQHKIIFNSEEYFELWKNNLALNDILSLGSRLRFVYNNEIIEIVP